MEKHREVSLQLNGKLAEQPAKVPLVLQVKAAVLATLIFTVVEKAPEGPVPVTL